MVTMSQSAACDLSICFCGEFPVEMHLMIGSCTPLSQRGGPDLEVDTAREKRSRIEAHDHVTAGTTPFPPSCRFRALPRRPHQSALTGKSKLYMRLQP